MKFLHAEINISPWEYHAMASASFSIFNWLNSADFWEWVQYGILGVTLVAVIVSYIADFTRLSNPEPRKRWLDRAAAILIVLSSLLEIVATFKANSINDKTIVVLRLQTGNATALAGQLGVSVNTLKVFVNTKSGAVDTAIQSLKSATDRASASLAKINPLAQKEEALRAEISRDEKNLSDDEKDLQAFEGAYAPRSLNQTPLIKDLPLFRGVPVFMSVLADTRDREPQRFAELLFWGLQWAHWNVQELPPVPFAFEGVTISYEDSLDGSSDTNPAAHAAARALCEKLAAQDLDPMVDRVRIGTEKDVGWPTAVPSNGLWITVGSKPDHFFENKKLKASGLASALGASEMTKPKQGRMLCG